MDYRTAINDIAARDSIRVDYDVRDLLDTYSQPADRSVHLTPWSTDERRAELQYWVALHEMGHVATTDPRFDPEFYAFIGAGREIVEAESKAWHWALREAGHLDETGKTVIEAAMGTYTNDFGYGGEATRKLAQTVRGSDAFASHRRDRVESLLA